MSDSSSIPIQVSIDATALTGRLSTRKLPGLKDGHCIIYGVLNGTHEKPEIRLEENTELAELISKSPKRSKKEYFIVNGLSAVPKLIEEGSLSRSKSYISVIALPLVNNPKPYCLSLVAQGEGFDSHSMLRIHISVCDAFTNAGLRVITLPGNLKIIFVISANFC